MAEGGRSGGAGAPRTDLPPSKEPYDEGYFGTDEEEGVVREREDPDAEKDAERSSQPAGDGSTFTPK